MSPRRCDTCFKTYAHRQSLFKHRKKCKGAYTSTARLSLPTVVDFKLSRVDRKQQHLRGDVPTFVGAEFCGEKPLSRVTLNKMMEMLNIPKERRERIAREEEKYQKEKFINESSSEPSNELELEETIEDFQQYYSDLIKNKNRENVPEMIDILNIWKDVGEISEHQYKEVLRKIK